jgi:hypothetical protein
MPLSLRNRRCSFVRNDDGRTVLGGFFDYWILGEYVINLTISLTLISSDIVPKKVAFLGVSAIVSPLW